MKHKHKEEQEPQTEVELSTKEPRNQEEGKEDANEVKRVPENTVSIRDHGGTEFMRFDPSGEKDVVQVTVCGTTQRVKLETLQSLKDALEQMLK